MIEKAFTKGTQVNGSDILFQQATAGTGGELSAGSFGVTFNWTDKRLFRSDVPKSEGAIFLPYALNGINYVNSAGKDVISSKFTGCYMVKYSVGGGARVAHVATPECNAAWNAIKGQPGVQVMAEFKPTDHIDFGTMKKKTLKMGDAGGEMLGIITADDKCYAIGAVKKQVAGVTELVVTSITQVK